ncbi:MAG TPA: hypothetical protein VHD69_02915 [Candidatus Paceibacterota bacterium]|jgi:hypothetical protein|nr:hypothetical protein [Candidatus Paceibacterota bacterium]
MNKTTKILIAFIALVALAGLVVLWQWRDNGTIGDTPESRAQVMDTLTAPTDPAPDQKVLDSLSAPKATPDPKSSAEGSQKESAENDILRSLQAN